MPNSIPNGDVSKIVSFVKGRENNEKEKVSFEKNDLEVENNLNIFSFVIWI